MGVLFSLRACLVAGLLVRLTFMFYGVCQDALMAVKFTDIDYHVFTDAAKFITQGESPYRRATYRYTPLLAWLLVPNVLISMVWGKLIFIMFDILAGYLIYRIVTMRGASKGLALVACWTWLLNPLPITISSRGNAESIMAVFVLATFYTLCKKQTNTAAILYGISVHFKIYPISYALPLYLVLSEEYLPVKVQNKATNKKTKVKPEQGSKSIVTEEPSKTMPPIGRFINLLWPNGTRIQFVFISATVFFGVTGVCYYLYGWEFLHETYLYHITRKDTRHNFSVYFYMLYLTESSRYASYLGVVTFIPQVVLMFVSSLKFHRDPVFSCFVNTIIFVSFNKVCTSQYFLWYLTLLPVVLPSITMSRNKIIKLILLWFGGQAVWLFPAYLLEFEGSNTFLWIWLAGIMFFLVNIYILYSLFSSYHHTPMFHGGRLHTSREPYKLPAWIQFYVKKAHSE